MENKKDERMIYLKDLLFAALYRWRAVLVTALIFAVLLGGFKVFSSWNTAKANAASGSSADHQLATEQYNSDLQDLDAQLAQLNQNLDTKIAYLADSVFMQLDPYDHYEATLTLIADTGNDAASQSALQSTDKTALVIAGYQALLHDAQMLQDMADAVGSAPRYMQELITAEISDSNALLIKIKYTSQEAAQALLDIVSSHLSDSKALIDSTVAEHTASIIGGSVNPCIDSAIEALQQKERDSLTATQTAIKAIQQQKSTLVAPPAYTFSFSVIVKDMILFAVLGCVIGVFLAVLAAWIMHISSGKVYSARTLKDHTGLKILNCIRDEHIKNPLDRQLQKLEGRNSADASRQIKLAAINVSNLCAGFKMLLISGDASGESRQALVQAFQEALPGVRIVDEGSLLESADSMKALAECDAVLLIEQCGLSRYDAVEQQIEAVTYNSKKLLGCVLLGG